MELYHSSFADTVFNWCKWCKWCSGDNSLSLRVRWTANPTVIRHRESIPLRSTSGRARLSVCGPASCRESSGHVESGPEMGKNAASGNLAWKISRMKSAFKPGRTNRRLCEAIARCTGQRCRNIALKGVPTCLKHGGFGLAKIRKIREAKYAAVHIARRKSERPLGTSPRDEVRQAV